MWEFFPASPLLLNLENPFRIPLPQPHKVIMEPVDRNRHSMGINPAPGAITALDMGSQDGEGGEVAHRLIDSQSNSGLELILGRICMGFPHSPSLSIYWGGQVKNLNKLVTTQYINRLTRKKRKARKADAAVQALWLGSFILLF